MKLVQFGAGNIGRSFIGQIFSMAGWEVIFIDVDRTIIDALNQRQQYSVVIKDKIQQTITVKNIRGVSALDIELVSDEVAQADLLSTAVGKKALPYIMKPIASGLIKRKKSFAGKPLDIIICENMRNAPPFFKRSLQKEIELQTGPSEVFPVDEWVGFVETSIGKMVPIMSEREKKKDPLLIYAEAYNTLIVDKQGFKGRIPEVPELDLKENMKAYVDRKLYIHNLGHAVLSYISFVFRRHYRYIWEAAYDRELSNITKNAMWESGKALIAEYSDEFDDRNIGDHINDFLTRFGNRALGDTIFRAGRDLYRKLGPDDRLIGGVNLCLKHGIAPKNIYLGVASALFFKDVDESGKMYENDRTFHEKEVPQGIDHVLKWVCKLEINEVISLIQRYYTLIDQGKMDISNLSYPKFT